MSLSLGDSLPPFSARGRRTFPGIDAAVRDSQERPPSGRRHFATSRESGRDVAGRRPISETRRLAEQEAVLNRAAAKALREAEKGALPARDEQGRPRMWRATGAGLGARIPALPAPPPRREDDAPPPEDDEAGGKRGFDFERYSRPKHDPEHTKPLPSFVPEMYREAKGSGRAPPSTTSAKFGSLFRDAQMRADRHQNNVKKATTAKPKPGQEEPKKFTTADFTHRFHEAPLDAAANKARSRAVAAEKKAEASRRVAPPDLVQRLHADAVDRQREAHVAAADEFIYSRSPRCAKMSAAALAESAARLTQRHPE